MPPVYTTETAQLVSHVSSGTQASTDPITVRFVNSMVTQNQIGQTLQSDVFTFTPTITGLATWQDMRTLTFHPNAPLAFRTTYRGQLNMAALFPIHPNLQPLDIQIEVAGREIVAITADFQLPDPNTPNSIIFEGQINFNAPTDLQTLINATTYRLDNQRHSLQWQAHPNFKTFTFKSLP
ncbi:MAG: hypothetical protein ACO36I_09585, partial [Candidatus Latescibacterota bacterium]